MRLIVLRIFLYTDYFEFKMTLLTPRSGGSSIFGLSDYGFLPKLVPVQIIDQISEEKSTVGYISCLYIKDFKEIIEVFGQ